MLFKYKTAIWKVNGYPTDVVGKVFVWLNCHGVEVLNDIKWKYAS